MKIQLLPATFLLVFGLSAPGAFASVIDSITLNSSVGTGDADVSFTITSVDTTLAAPITGLFTATLTVFGDLTDNSQDGISLASPDSLGIMRGLFNGSGTSSIDFFAGRTVAGPYGPFSQSFILNAADFGGSVTSFQAQQRYVLTAGDNASVSSTFELSTVSQVPLPPTFALLTLGLLGLRLRRDS